MIDLDEMESLARAATPGPWELNRHGAVLGGPIQQYVNGNGKNQLAMATGADWMRPDEMICNAEHIAAANPAAVLELVALARQAPGAGMAAIPAATSEQLAQAFPVARESQDGAPDPEWPAGGQEAWRLGYAAAQQGGGKLPQDELPPLPRPTCGDHSYGGIDMQNYARAALAQRAASVPAKAISLIVRDIAELDYGSDIKPDLMQVTVEDLKLIIERHAAPVPAASVQPVTVTLDGHQLRMALDLINPDGLDDRDQLDNDLTFGVRQHRDDDGTVSTGMCCWNDDTDGVLPLDGEYEATPSVQPDIGRDAARLNAFIDWYLRGGQRSEIHADGHMVQTTRAIVIKALDALATPAAPEVASVPDAGDDPVYWSVTYRGEHNANAFPTKGLAHATLERLNAARPGEPREIVPLYTRPQPAHAVLLEQAAQACDQQADGTNGPYRSACLQCADAVRELRDAAATKGAA